MKKIIYAIGDIHGQFQLLEILLERINSYHFRKNPQANADILFLGDYIDRGLDSKKVIDTVRAGSKEFGYICLKGNHEALMLECLQSDDRNVWHTWIRNGGDATLRSFGYSVALSGYDHKALRTLIDEDRFTWLNSLELSYMHDDILFVHAGIEPEVPLSDQTERALLWIRNKFLNFEGDHGFGVVHGHTPNDAPIIKRNRIGIDTDAGSGKELTALVIDCSWDKLRKNPKFLIASWQVQLRPRQRFVKGSDKFKTLFKFR